MTKITRVIKRETASFDRGRAIRVAMHPRHMELWLATERRKLQITYESIWWIAVKADAEQKRLEKLIARRNKRKGQS